MAARLILASASPRRRELLGQLGVAFEVVPADVDETPRGDEPPREYVGRVAREKAQAVAARHPGTLVLAADTSVVLGRRILGKPGSFEEAMEMLGALSGRTHEVLTAVALAGTFEALHVEATSVTMRSPSEAELAWYVGTGEPMDKAGAYAIQGRGGQLVDRISGSASNVVGLPLAQTLQLLERAGHPLPWSSP